MNILKYAAVLTLMFSSFGHNAFATDRIYRDIIAESPSRRYKVEAKSPDNVKEEYNAFQASFVYKCWDTQTKKLLWTRKQAMGKPKRLSEGSTETYSFPEEASPVEIFVSDAGWSVIRTGWDELIAVDVSGYERSPVDLLSSGITKQEQKKYVHQTTAGPLWTGYSLWYFLDVDGQNLFVVRPWWGRRIIVDLNAGKVAAETSKIMTAALSYEQRFVLTELAKGINGRKKLEKEECCEAHWQVATAVYLAGWLQVKEAIPLLEQLQDSSHSGSSTCGGMSALERFEGEVDPHSYSTLSLRQVVHLSLRRLGKTPKVLPLTQFDVQYEDYKKHHPYKPKPLSVPRDANVGKVTKGMKAEQVLDLIGEPDFVGYDTWEYDIDARTPYSLILKWDVRHVIDIEKKTPALWKESFVRDEQIVY